MYHEVFKSLGIEVIIKINNRKVLFGLAEAAGIANHFVDMTVAIDKLDKIGKEGVEKELVEKGINAQAIEKIFAMLSVSNYSDLTQFFDENSEGKKGLVELQTVFSYLQNSNVDNVHFDVKLARGLGYYTGCIFEVAVDTSKHSGVVMGSIGGGGRYDNLTASFGLSGMSGVGISFGAERIYDVLTELNLFPTHIDSKPKIVLMAMDRNSLFYAFQVASQLRSFGLNIDIYPEPSKLKKQIKYADDKGVQFAGIIGEQEVTDQKVMCKNLLSGEQNLVSIQELVTILQK
ncbi:MAG TPA: His/Gly/Thr/Pro-type tRNA ligase C-terminal domain-containing protein [Saprospiraceae bacterium]|nr:His/Gly/Thr/Pro-type tRNA ligase C-terminal domain-containing protein [Saprospiraceae bacterium]